MNKGFTLMELTIVLAILAILALILVPIFLNSTDRARLRGDIQSARVIQNAVELYRVERGRTLTGSMSTILTTLENSGFLSASDTDIQTEGASWIINAQQQIVVNIANSPDGVHRAYSTLPEAERQAVANGRGG